MKKLLLILTLSIVACRKIAPINVVPVNSDVFSVSQSSVENGQEIEFHLSKNGTYTLTLGDSVANQVLTRERFIGQIGTNKKKIYTKSLSVKYLYLLLEDESKNKIGKTIIIVK